ncbi:hypothetical protein J7L48_01285 [bacterium]|nr:hypothetical protein [bacterium]
MSSINQKINKLNKKLCKFLASKEDGDFNSFYKDFNNEILGYFLSKRFKGLWKLERIVDNAIGGIDNIKNDILIKLHKGHYKEPTLNFLLNKISFKILEILKNKETFLTMIPNLLEYSHSLTFSNYYEYQEILDFNDFLLLEIFNIIYDAFYNLLKEGKTIFFYHYVLFINEEDIKLVLDEEELNVSQEILKEMQEFWTFVEKRGIFYLFIVFIESNGDLEQFKSFLNGETLEIFNERTANKLSYGSIDNNLNIIGSEEILHHILHDYIKSLKLVDDIMGERKKGEYAPALWNLVSKPAFFTITDFLKNLLDKKENIREFEGNINGQEVDWSALRKIEEINKFPKYYLEEYSFKSSIIDLFSPI